jgi:hypothetical protein
MDVDALSIEKRRELLEKRACFHCEKPGHFAKDCRTKKASNSAQNTSAPADNKTRLPIKDAARSIRTLLAQYTGEEEEAIFKACEELSMQEDFH